MTSFDPAILRKIMLPVGRRRIPADTALAALVLLFVAVYLGWHLYSTYQQTLEHEFDVLEVNTSHAEARISDNLRSIDFLLQGVAGDRLHLPAAGLPALERSMDEKVQAIPVVERLGTATADGRIDASSAPRFRGDDISTSDYFRVHFSRTARRKVFISKPYRDADGKTYFFISNAIRDSRKKVVGVAFATVSSAIFADTLLVSQSIAQSPTLLANLRGEVLYATTRSDPCQILRPYERPEFREHIASDDAATRHLSLAADGEHQCLSIFHSVPGTPLLLASFRNYDEAVLPWKRESIATLARFALVLLFVVHFVRKERQQGQKIRRLSERMVESASVVVLGLNAKGEIGLFNRMAEELTGYRRAEILGQNCFGSLIPTDRAPQAWISLQQGSWSKDSPIQPCESTLIAKDGTEHLIVWQTLSMPEDDAEFMLVAFGTDVTEMRRTEALFRAIAEQSHDALLILDRDCRLRYASPAARRVMAFRAQPGNQAEASGPLFTAEDEPALSAFRNILDKPGQSVVFEQTIHGSEGRTLTIEVVMTNLLDKPGVNGVFAIGRDITRRKDAERALAVSELNLRKAQEITRVGSWSLDLRNGEYSSSDEILRIYGIVPDGPTGYDVNLSRIHPLDRAWVEPHWQAAMDGRAPYDIVHRLVVDGKTKWVSERADIEYDQAGRPLRVMGAVQDITDRMLTQQALLAAQETLRQLIDHSPLAMLIAEGSERSIVLANRKFRQLTGYDANDLPTIERWWHLACPDPEYRSVVQAQWAARCAARTDDAAGAGIEMRAVCKDGATRIFQLQEASIGEQGLFIMLDLTERRHAESRLSETVAFNARIIEESPAAISVYRADGQCVMTNEAAVEISGVPRDALLTQNFRRLDSWLVRDFIAAADQVLNEGVVVHDEAHFEISSGEEIWLTYEFSPITLNGERHLLAVFTDVSKFRKAEQALREAAAVADTANRSKGEFLANMSHEIRTPMNAVIGLSQLALAEVNDPHLRDYLQKIHDASRDLLGLLNDVLDYSKIEAGQLRIEATEFSLRDLVSNTYQLFQVESHNKDIDFSFEVAEDVPQRVMGDWLRLSQVLNNLVSNALKFTVHGTVRIRLARIGGEDACPLLRFEIVDTGIGMTPEQIDNLFQPFVQADGSITRRFGGTGLGLAISRRLLALMGGTISAESHFDAGSAFRFELRLQAAPDLPGTSLRSPVMEAETSATKIPQQLIGAHVLVVEDDTFNQVVIAEFLHKAGMQTRIAANGKEALEQLERERFDLVVMDLQMPQMDGFEATRQIRADARWANLPIVAVTAAAMERDREMSLAVGMNDHLAKPVEFSRLIEVLAHWIPPGMLRASELLPPPYAGNPDVVGEKLSVLQSMIDANEFVPDDALRELQSLLPTTASGDFRDLEQALSRYDYARARAALAALAARLSV